MAVPAARRGRPRARRARAGAARRRPADPLGPTPLLLSLLDQAALALERIALESEMATVTQLKERDRLRAALLSSVSHDLRTPLTTIPRHARRAAPPSVGARARAGVDPCRGGAAQPLRREPARHGADRGRRAAPVGPSPST
ncbi:MAG: hypothetical protein WDN24_17840 [Sphingomonas sp.]